MRRKFIDIPDHARRDFIKWTVGLGAALGLRPWKVFEVTESIVGPAVAGTAACTPVNRAQVVAGMIYGLMLLGAVQVGVFLLAGRLRQEHHALGEFVIAHDLHNALRSNRSSWL